VALALAVVVEVEGAGAADLVVVEVDVDEPRPATLVEGPPHAQRITERIAAAAAATVLLRKPDCTAKLY
jgi:hypothetical protein